MHCCALPPLHALYRLQIYWNLFQGLIPKHFIVILTKKVSQSCKLLDFVCSQLTFEFGTIGLRVPKSGFPKPSFFNKSSGDPWLFSFPIPTAFCRFLKVFGFLKAFGLKVESLVLCLSSSGRVEPCPVLLEKEYYRQIPNQIPFLS